ncbi:MAG: exodeoxyribonuclease VII large subunit [Desulfomonilaceae bacterium]
MELPSRKIYSVSELTDQIRSLLESNFSSVWLKGEISNFKKAPSGHAYFTLKDDSSQIRSVMFKLQSRFVKFKLEDGLQVLAWGRVSVYGPRGDYQFIVDTIEPAGLGSLMLSFEQLKMKLAAEGLFDQSLKRPIPKFPKTVGVVTSASGAAVRDIIKIIHRRSPNINILVSPALVQGDKAPQEIVNALRRICTLDEIDVIIVGRGGGSVEDLWAFNAEEVVREVALCPKPIVSAVGHETDFTLTDFASDVRASTPSAAAELVAPDVMELEISVHGLLARLKSAMFNSLERRSTSLQDWYKRLYDPRRSILQKRQQLDELVMRLRNSMIRSLDIRRENYNDINRRLRIELLQRKLNSTSDETLALVTRLGRAINARLAQARSNLAAVADKIDNLSPLKVLARGYSITFRLIDGKIVTDADAVSLGEKLKVRLARGELVAEVTEKR